MLRKMIVLLGCGLIVGSCESSTPRASQTVQDSAGVRVIENAGKTWGADGEWTIEVVPALAIGVAEGDPRYQFHRVYDVLRLPDGNIIVGNSGSSELRTYGSDGVHLRSFGRRGAGPGEFHEFSSLRLCRIAPNELLVGDAFQDRSHLFTNDGEYLRTISLQRVPDGSAPNPIGCFADGTLLTAHGMGTLSPDNPGTVIQGKFEYHRYNLDGKSIARIAELNSRPRYVNLVGGVTNFPFIPLTAASSIAPADSAVFVTEGDVPQIERRSLDGRTVALIRWAPANRLASADVYERYKEESLAGITDRQRRVQYANFYAQKLPIPDSVPVTQALRVDELGHLWVERYRMEWDTIPTHELFDPEGKWLGTINTPARMEIFQIGSDYILGREQDELGVQRIVVYRLNR